VECRLVFCSPSRKLKIVDIPNVLAYGNSYEHYFMKKRDGHKLCPESCAKSSSNSFSCTISEIKNTSLSQRTSLWEVVRAQFCEKMRRS
ncbi:hypothetical protein BHE74_00016372, partial [Ensete ventricosum]